MDLVPEWALEVALKRLVSAMDSLQHSLHKQSLLVGNYGLRYYQYGNVRLQAIVEFTFWFRFVTLLLPPPACLAARFGAVCKGLVNVS
jgi:hypothetical protein